MKPKLQKHSSRPLRVMFGTVLALHIGLVHAGMAHAGMVHDAIHQEAGSTTLLTATAGAAGLPCHTAVDRGALAADVSTDAAAPNASHAPCCAVSDCHCAGACDQGAVLTPLLIGTVRYSAAIPMSARSTVPPQLARELRPPIAD